MYNGERFEQGIGRCAGRQAGICDMAEEILRITGGQRLEGTVTVNGGKNAALAIIPAVLLCNEPCTIENLPFVRDTEALADILLALGAKVTLAGSTMTIDPRGVKSAVVPEEYARRLRASYYFVGAMLGCFGQADVSYPGAAPSATAPSISTSRALRRWARPCPRTTA